MSTSKQSEENLKMKVKGNLPSHVLDTVCAMLEPYISDINSGNLEDCLRGSIERYLTIKEVAGILNCTYQHIFNLTNQGRLEKLSLGKRMTRIPLSSVESLLRKSKCKKW